MNNSQNSGSHEKKMPESSRSVAGSDDLAKVASYDQGIRKALAEAQKSPTERSDVDGWRIVFAGDRNTLVQLIDPNPLGLPNNLDISPGSYFKCYEEFTQQGYQTLHDEIIGNYASNPYDAIFSTDAQFVRIFSRRWHFGTKDFDTPIILVSPSAAVDVKAIGKPNIYSIDPTGKTPDELQAKLKKAIIQGKEFVDKINKAAILLMVNNPDDYSNLKKRDPGKVWLLKPTKKDYELATSYLSSRDPLVGAVVVDRLDHWQEVLLIKAQNETAYKNIPRVYVGTDHPPKIDDYECIVIPGGEIAASGLRRVVEEHFNPNREKEKATDSQIIELHDVFRYDRRTGELLRSRTTRFDEGSGTIKPKTNGYEVPGNRRDSRRIRFVEDQK